MDLGKRYRRRNSFCDGERVGGEGGRAGVGDGGGDGGGGEGEAESNFVIAPE